MTKIIDIMKIYLDHVKIYKTVGTYKYYIKMYVSLTKALEALNIEYTEQIDDNFMNTLTNYYKTKTTKKNSKINDTISALITAFKFSNIQYPKRYKLRDDTESFTALSIDDIKDMFMYLNSIDIHESNKLTWKIVVYLFIETGIRLSELLDIRTENIDLKNRIIKLDHTKNGYKRYVFYDVLSEPLIKKVYDARHDKLIWNHLQNKPMTKISIWHFFSKMNKELKFNQSIHPHRLRKTFATQLLKKGCPLTTISKILGHRDIKQTMIYLQIDNRMLNDDYRTYYPY